MFKFNKPDFRKKDDSPKPHLEKSYKINKTIFEEEEKKKKKIKEMNTMNKLGYTFGYKDGVKYDLRKKRADNFSEIKKEFGNFFKFENITTTSKELFSNTVITTSNAESIRERLIQKKNNQKFLRISKREKKYENVKNK